VKKRERRTRLQLTLIRQIEQLIDNDTTGLMPGFVFQAITEFAKQVRFADPEQLTKDHGTAVHHWSDCAKAIWTIDDDDLDQMLDWG
jgi:hypothetical protein